jgi:hypothetical protein
MILKYSRTCPEPTKYPMWEKRVKLEDLFDGQHPPVTEMRFTWTLQDGTKRLGEQVTYIGDHIE